MKKILAISILAVALIFTASCGQQVTKREASFLTLFDTVTRIVQYTDDEEGFAEIAEFIRGELEGYHQLYDIYKDYDGIANIKTVNDNAGIAPVKVDRRIIDLVLAGKLYNEETGGRVNIAYGAVLSIWHDYRTDGIDNPSNAKLPPMELLEEAAEHTDISDVIVDEEKSTVFLKDPEMSLDVGAIAKGYAVERVIQLLEDRGVESLLLSVGGNVRAIGGKDEDNTPWRVGIQDPEIPNRAANLHILDLVEKSLVTSGNYSRYYVVNGKRYHHIINPDTLFPAEYFDSLTIICVDSGRADALSTAIYNMPFDQGLKLIESLQETEAFWIFPDGTQKHSSNFFSD